MELPSANVSIDASSTAAQIATSLLTVIAAVPLNADAVPWMVGNAAALYAENGYCEGADFVADYITRTRKPVLFVPIPIATPGTVGSFDISGNTNTSAVSVAVGAYGSLDRVEGRIRVHNGGVVGTDQISIDYSLDDGLTWVEDVRVGTAVTYTIPYIGQIVSFGGGSLTAGETVLTWKSSAPMWGSAGMAAAETALLAQELQSGVWHVVGDIKTAAIAGYVTTAVNAYDTAGRAVVAKCALKDRLPSAALSHTVVHMTGAPSVTFAEVGAGNDTAVRSGGSFVTDGFHSGGTVRITGAVAGGGHNNITGVATVTNATTLTFPAAGADLDAEGPIAGVSMSCETTLTFGDNGGSEDTITRTAGSWLEDGFRVGDVFTIAGTASNNGTWTITGVTPTVVNVATGSFAAEVIGANSVTMTAGQTKAQHLADNNAVFASIAAQPLIDLGHGCARTLSPILKFYLRRNVNYFDTIRAFQHDLHIATWKKANGPIDGASLVDAVGTLVEHDERIDSGALSAGFTCFRTWGNGPRGAFIARSVTRAAAGNVLSATENVRVANLVKAVAQQEAENAIGQELVLKIDGTATAASLASIKQRIDSALARNVLADVEGEGQRASLCYVTLAADDDLSGVDATLNGVITLVLLGKIAHINLTVRVNPGA